MKPLCRPRSPGAFLGHLSRYLTKILNAARQSARAGGEHARETRPAATSRHRLLPSTAHLATRLMVPAPRRPARVLHPVVEGASRPELAEESAGIEEG